MFTGIVTAIGTIESVEQRGDLRVRIACPFDPGERSPSAPRSPARACA